MADGKTTVVRIRRKDGKVVQDCDVYIGRPMNQGGWSLPGSKWANPLALKAFRNDRAACLAAYRAHVEARRDLMDSLEELRGKRLGCWCMEALCHTCRAPQGTCAHLQCRGEVLIQLLNARTRPDVR